MNSGDRLGGYEVLGPLGAGGMGEVYRARDLRLGREVALKVLSRAMIRSPDSLSRFEREARALAALSHPHVAVLRGLEEAGEERFLVMELVRGEALDRRLATRGRLPVPEALEVAAQVADALEAAHARGIVHRDLKPANVMIGPRDEVKLLDFMVRQVVGPSAPALAARTRARALG
jgi:serine/threonine protein kinase